MKLSQIAVGFVMFFLGFLYPSLTTGQTLRIASYNLQDKPITSSQDQDIRAILSEIGSESISGVARPLDLLGFQEGPPTIGSYSFLEADFENAFGGDYEAVVAPADPNGDRIGFVYNTGTLVLVSANSYTNLGFTHIPMLATFRPVGGQDSDEFSVFSIHLKAGSSGSDFSQRQAEAIQLGNLIDSLPAERPIIILGDFNIKGSFEDAFSELSNHGMKETINAPVGLRTADWNNNIGFHAFHTQDSTGATGGMDDRFDVMLVNQGFFNRVGIEYNPGSLRTLGNNGTHTLNSSIFSGSGASGVQTNLTRISDHLPIYAEFDWGVFRTVPDSLLMNEATSNYTVRPSGPRTGASGSSFFQIEGSDNGTFACFGIVDFDLSNVISSGIATRVDEVKLGLVQENESFTRDGPISIYAASPAASAVSIDSSIQFQSGNDRLACVPVSLANGAVKLTTVPALHHSSSGGDLPDGTIDEFVLNGDAIQTAVLNAINHGTNLRLLIVPDHPDTAATYAGNTNSTREGPTLQGLYDASNGQRQYRIQARRRGRK